MGRTSSEKARENEGARHLPGGHVGARSAGDPGHREREFDRSIVRIRRYDPSERACTRALNFLLRTQKKMTIDEAKKMIKNLRKSCSKKNDTPKGTFRSTELFFILLFRITRITWKENMTID